MNHAEAGYILQPFGERKGAEKFGLTTPTTVLSMPIDEASAKIQTGPPGDDDEDAAWPVWAGVIPATLQFGKPAPDPRLGDVAVPDHALSLSDRFTG